MSGGKKRVIVGSVTTRHEREQVMLEVTDGEVSGLDDFLAALDIAQRIEEKESKDPWGHNADHAVNFAKHLIETETRKALFRERQDKGWYGREILLLEKEVRAAISNRNAEWAAVFAARMGDLAKEALMKFNWDSTVEYAKKAKGDRKDGGERTRKYPEAVYRQTWKKHFDICGKRTEADKLAADELRVSERTIREARRKST